MSDTDRDFLRDPTSPNAEQIEYWNVASGPTWVRQAAAIESQLEPLGLAAIERAAPQPGEAVVDVGCGCGSTVLELARRVGPSGTVVGLDISEPMLGLARQRVDSAGLRTVTLRLADAQTADLTAASADLLFSRFGVMFFTDPVAAFQNLRGALRRRGRLVFICWQPLARNPWMSVPIGALASLVTLPAPLPPEAPGPFAFGDPDRVRTLLGQAGYANVQIEPLEHPLSIAGGGDAVTAARFFLEIGPAARIIRESPGLDMLRVEAAVVDALAPFTRPGGVVLDSACWIVSASHSTAGTPA